MPVIAYRPRRLSCPWSPSATPTTRCSHASACNKHLNSANRDPEINIALSPALIRAVLMQFPPLASLAVPAVLLLISFLGYSSQYLFQFIEPQPLTQRELFRFNLLLAALLISYARACTTDPGRLPVEVKATDPEERNVEWRARWCRKCNSPKFPRAHHCKTCGR